MTGGVNAKYSLVGCISQPPTKVREPSVFVLFSYIGCEFFVSNIEYRAIRKVFIAAEAHSNF